MLSCDHFIDISKWDELPLFCYLTVALIVCQTTHIHFYNFDKLFRTTVVMYLFMYAGVNNYIMRPYQVW